MMRLKFRHNYEADRKLKLNIAVGNRKVEPFSNFLPFSFRTRTSNISSNSTACTMFLQIPKISDMPTPQFSRY